MLRGKYFDWDEAAIGALTEYVEKGLSWPVISGRMSALYDVPLSAEAVRGAWNRYGADSSPSPAGSPAPAPGLPRAFQRVPFVVRERQIQEQRNNWKFTFSVLLNQGYTQEELQAEINRCWKCYCDYLLERGEATAEEATAAATMTPPKWFTDVLEIWSIWQPGDDTPTQGRGSERAEGERATEAPTPVA